jgi:hypothetical protein
MKKLFLLLLGFLVVPGFLAACVPADGGKAADAPSASATIEETCTTAGSLISTNPEQALALIDRIRLPYAPQETVSRTACEEQRLAAIKAMGESQSRENQVEPNEAVRTEKTWDTFVKSWLAPLQNLGLAWFGTVFGLLILSRLLALLPRPMMPFKYLPWRHASKWIRGITLTLGLILVTRCSTNFIALLLGIDDEVSNKESAEFLILGLGALLGSLLLATWMASRPRLSIDVRDTEGKPRESRASNVIALLQDLGGGPARGLEIPRGADATGLDNIPLPQTSPDGVFGALQRLFQNIFSVTPWRVIVDATSDDLLSVIITRNGWSAQATTIDRSNTLIFPRSFVDTKTASAVPPADLYKMAAAFILVTLAQQYQGYKGLGGATDWRSVGLQFLATTDYEGKKEQQIALLSQALELDPNNLPAGVALRNLKYRHSNQEDQQLYKQWLEDALGWFNASAWRQIGQRALLRRIRLSYLFVTMNLIPTEPDTGSDSGLNLEMPYNEATKLMEGLSKTSEQTASLENRLRPHAALLLADIERMLSQDASLKPWSEDWREWLRTSRFSSAPTLAYNSACSLARQDADWNKVKPRLDAAMVDPELRAAVATDPELAAYADKEPRMKEYRKGLEEPKQNCFGVVKRRIKESLMKACSSEE